MSFLSLTWVTAIWVTVGVYWLVPRAARPFVLMALSLGFMALVDLQSAVLLVLAFGLTVLGTQSDRMTLATLLGTGGVLICVLAGFKISAVFETEHFLRDAGIPLGLSYYVFRCLHVLIEKFKGTLGTPKPKDLAAYLFFLPTFVIGPIHRFPEFVRDQARQRFDTTQILIGAERIIVGYAKIVILSNLIVEGLLGQVITVVAPTSQWLATYLGIVQDGLNFYLQFSGHSDIAIGFAAAIGFRVMENFDYPYLKPNISAFWRSWHISLSQWCRDYVYVPVVAKSRNPALGALTTMVAIGLWHEISLRYILWGLFHGLGLIVWNRFNTWRDTRFKGDTATWRASLNHWASVFLTVNFVWFSFVILTTPDLRDVPGIFLTVLTGGVL